MTNDAMTKADQLWLEYAGNEAKSPTLLMAVMKLQGVERNEALEAMWRQLHRGNLRLTADRWIVRANDGEAD